MPAGIGVESSAEFFNLCSEELELPISERLNRHVAAALNDAELAVVCDRKDVP